MNELCISHWTRGEVDGFYYFEIDGSPACCNAERFILNVIPQRTHIKLDFEKFNARFGVKHIYQHNEYEQNVVDFIKATGEQVDAYIMEMEESSMFYVFTRQPATYNLIHAKIRSM